MAMIRCKKKENPYTFIEYIESTGTQYINLGISGRFRAKFDIMYMAFPEGIIGGYITSGSNYIRNYLVCYNNLICYGWNAGSEGVGFHEDRYNVPPNNIKLNCEYSTISGNIKYAVDGRNIYSSSQTNAETSFNNYFGAINDNGNVGPISKYKLYGLKYYSSMSDDDIVLDLVPAIRNSDGVAGLYDKISGTFLTNAGTGTFVVPT